MFELELIPIRKQLNRIEKKLEGNYSNKFLDINQVAGITSLSTATIHRAVKRGQLKCSKNVGKLLFKQSEILKWIEG